MSDWQKDLSKNQVGKINHVFDFADSITSVIRKPATVKDGWKVGSAERLVVTYVKNGKENTAEISAQHSGKRR